MDTGTHIVMGIALGGLATVDPVVASEPITAMAVMFGTILGSQAPDIDTVLKFKNNAVYIRNHRGITHSLPFSLLLWPILISGLLSQMIPGSNLPHLWLWTFIAVCLHVFVDLFNAYGTQALRPISSKWVAFGIINTFDPFIFGVHIAGLIIWSFGFSPVATFSVIYLILIMYYIMRFAENRKVKNLVKQQLPFSKRIIVSPTLRYHQWKIAVIGHDKFYVAKVCNHEFVLLDTFERIPLPNSPVLEAALLDKNLSAFVSFSPIYRWEISETNAGFMVRFVDLRYRSSGRYPFVAVIHLNEDLTITKSYTGWIFSEEKLLKKLSLLPY